MFASVNAGSKNRSSLECVRRGTKNGSLLECARRDRRLNIFNNDQR